jgi:hypothetical protein
LTTERFAVEEEAEEEVDEEPLVVDLATVAPVIVVGVVESTLAFDMGTFAVAPEEAAIEAVDDNDECDEDEDDDRPEVMSSESLVECLRLLCEQRPLLSSRSSSAEHEPLLRRFKGDDWWTDELPPLPVDLAKLSTREKLDVRLLMMLLMDEMLLLHNKSSFELFKEHLVGWSKPSIGVGGSGLSAGSAESAAIGLEIMDRDLVIAFGWLLPVGVACVLPDDKASAGSWLPNEGDKMFSMLNLSDLIELGDKSAWWWWWGWWLSRWLNWWWSRCVVCAVFSWPLVAAATAAAAFKWDPILE